MRRIIRTADAPLSLSPVSQAVMAGGLVFVGGQMPRDLHTGKIVEGALAQARLSLAHCMAILHAVGSGADRVMLAEVFLIDLGEKEAMNTAFAEFFGHTPPARNMVEVSKIGEGAIVEIGVIALA